MNKKKNVKKSDEASKEPNEEAVPEESARESSELEPHDIIAALEEENTELKDRLLRAVAEMENIRRRSDREKTDALSYAVTGFARDLLSVADNLRRALEAMADHGKLSEQGAVFLDGVEMTERELLRIFDLHGIKKISPEGEKFDHNFHQALFEVDDPDAEPGTVVQVVQPGYVLKDRLLRPAMVGVSKTNSGKDKDFGKKIDQTV